jgi:hypothetical protein
MATGEARSARRWYQAAAGVMIAFPLLATPILAVLLHLLPVPPR